MLFSGTSQRSVDQALASVNMAAAPEASTPQLQSNKNSKKSKRNRDNATSLGNVPAPVSTNNSCAAAASTPPTTRHLEFNQAMTDFKVMFPKMDLATIETVLRANEGAVDATIDQLLTLTAETPDESTPSMDQMHLQHTPTGHSPPPMYSHSSALIGDDQPPPYSPPSPTSPYSQVNRPALARNSNTLTTHDDTVFQEFMSTLQISQPPTNHNSSHQALPSFRQSTMQATPPTTTTTLASFTPPPRASQGPPSFRQSMSSPAAGTHRRWNPPLLGLLPDTFLRLSSPSSSSVSHTPSIVSSHLMHRLQRNVEQRSSVDKHDVEMQQMLNDERVALYMQNEEFMRELQHNPEFSEALENDVMEATRNASRRNSRLSQTHQSQPSQHPIPPAQIPLHRNDLNSESTSPAEGAAGGAGAVPGADDVVFRDKLKHMGKSTKVKFSLMARKFNSKKKKKSSRAGLEGAPYMQSTANLLDSEEDDDSLLHRHRPKVEENIYADSRLI